MDGPAPERTHTITFHYPYAVGFETTISKEKLIECLQAWCVGKNLAEVTAMPGPQGDVYLTGTLPDILYKPVDYS